MKAIRQPRPKMDMQRTYDSLKQFIAGAQNELGDNRQNNYFGIVFGEVPKYYLYLSMIMSRYEPACAAYLETVKRRMVVMREKGAGSWTMTPEEVSRQDVELRQQTLLLLELESFYAFTSILLDRIAAATRYYFGPGNTGLQWKSFRSMQDNLVKYADAKSLGAPSQEMVELIDWLYENVSDFRNRFLIHKHETDSQVRSMFGVGFSDDYKGGVYFNVGQLYPREGDIPVIAKRPEEILENIDELIRRWQDYLTQNAAHRELAPPVN